MSNLETRLMEDLPLQQLVKKSAWPLPQPFNTPRPVTTTRRLLLLSAVSAMESAVLDDDEVVVEEE